MLDTPNRTRNPLFHPSNPRGTLMHSRAKPRHWFDKTSLIQRFTLSPLYRHDERILSRIHSEASKRGKKLRPAAVMIALVERHNELFLLLTKRAAHLKHHPGQISFPGGKAEPFDATLSATAQREMFEEVGIKVEDKHIIGQLMPIPTISGYMVTPIIGFIDANYHATLDPNEVDSLFEIPLTYLLEKNAIQTELVKMKGKTYPIHAISYQEHLIWGVTAHILYALNQQLS